MSVEFGYQRRWLVNFTVLTTARVGAEDHTQFSVIAPSDPRLPGGGG